jgi:hypothetical protein
MKKRYRIIAGLIAVIFIYSSSLKAQGRICLPPQINKSFNDKFLKARKNNLFSRTLANQQQLRVFFHIVKDNNGSEPGATSANITAEFAGMQTDYAPGNICFIYVGLDYIANSTLNHINAETNRGEAIDLCNSYAVPGCMNIFYTYEIKGKNSNSGGGIGGVTFDAPTTWCLVAKSNIGRQSASHETGHCFDLKHTYSDDDGEEYISGEDCDSRGDDMCDTKADPYSHALEDCFHTVDGKYDGTCEDPAGATNFSPPYDNIMSYWPGKNQIFTNDQFEEMHYTIENDDDIKATTSYTNFTMTPNQYFNGYVYVSAINSLSVLGTEFTGLVTAGLYGNTVTLKAGFHAQPLTSSVTIKATECNTGGSAAVASMSPPQEIKTANKTIKDPLNNYLVIYPNPSTNYFNIQYKQATTFNALINVRNVNGQIVFTSVKNNVLNLQERINLGNKAKGVYFVEVYVNGRRLTAKAVMQ